MPLRINDKHEAVVLLTKRKQWPSAAVATVLSSVPVRYTCSVALVQGFFLLSQTQPSLNLKGVYTVD